MSAKCPGVPADVTLPVTPMLDMSFQLLAFFVVTFRPIPTEGQLPVQLSSVATGAPSVLSNPQVEGPTDEYTIRVHSVHGEIAAMSLRGPTFAETDMRSSQELSERLAALSPNNVHTRVAITIESSPELRYERLMELMDRCKRAGHPVVGLAPLRG